MSDSSPSYTETQTQSLSETFTATNFTSLQGNVADTPESLGIFTAGFQIVLGVLILAGNILVLVVFRRSATLGTTTRFLLGNLAVADLMFGATSIIRGGMDLTGTPVGEKFCPHLLGVMCLAIIATAGTAAAVSAHASYIVHQGALYSDRRSLRFFLGVEGVLWGVSVCVYLLGGFLPTVPVSTECTAMSGGIHFAIPGIVAVCTLLGLLTSVMCHMITTRRLAASFSEIRQMEMDEERELEMQSGPADGNLTSNITETTGTTRRDPSGIQEVRVKEAWGQEVRGQEVKSQEVRSQEVRDQEVRGDESRGRYTREQKVRGQEVQVWKVKVQEVRAGGVRGRESRRSVGRMRRYRRERHGFLLILTVTLVMFSCMTPAVVVHLIGVLAPERLPRQLPAAITSLLLLNSLMNAVIYFVKDSSFRERCREIFRCATQVHPL